MLKIRRSKSLFVYRPAAIVAVLCGLLDSSVWVAASHNGSYFSLYYTVSVPCKALIILAFISVIRINNARLLLPFCIPIIVTVCVSIILGNTTLEGVTQPIGMLTSLALTLLILRDENLASYMKAFGLSCLMSGLIFLYQLKFVPLDSENGLLDLYGRYSFISGTQPNLGGEILFTGFVAFCLARLNTRFLVATFALFLWVLVLLQSRTAMISMFIAFCLYLYVEKIRLMTPINRVKSVALVAMLFACYVICDTKSISNLFLLENQYRGLDTGFVGREDHWQYAMEIFEQNPLFGAGFGYFRHYVTTPHSMWLGMLSMMGLMSVFVFMTMMQNVWRIYHANEKIFLLLLSFIPMTILNDRFLNLNPYPFLLFVLLFLPHRALAPRRQERAAHFVRRAAIDPKRGLKRFGNA